MASFSAKFPTVQRYLVCSTDDSRPLDYRILYIAGFPSMRPGLTRNRDWSLFALAMNVSGGPEKRPRDGKYKISGVCTECPLEREELRPCLISPVPVRIHHESPIKMATNTR